MKLKLIIPAMLAMVPAMTIAQTTDPSYAELPDSTDILTYRLGGARVVPIPGSGYITYKVDAHFKAGLGYSCGEFDFHQNLSQMINQIQTQARQIPIQLQNAVSAAVAALPGYLMQKINPNLYNIVTKSLDETTELFRLSYKSCKTMESEMQRNGSDYNPYEGFMNVAIAGNWEFGANTGMTIDEAKDAVDSKTPAPIRWWGGELYGTVDNPIQVNHDLVIAGYNLMLGRTGDVSTNAIPTGNLAQQPIVRIWHRPSDAAEWIQRVVGDLIIVTSENPETPNAQATSSITGNGLRPMIRELEPAIRDALNLAVEDFDFTDIKNYPSLKVSERLIRALQDLPLGERAVYMERLTTEFALNETVERARLIKQMLLLGLRHPDNIVAKISGETEKVVRKKTLPDLARMEEDIIKSMKIKNSTLIPTALTILNQFDQRQRSGIAEQPTPLNRAPASIGGAVAE